MAQKRKVIEVIEGYASIGELGHFRSVLKFGSPAWECPNIYKENPNPEKFRKVRITYEDRTGGL